MKSFLLLFAFFGLVNAQTPPAPAPAPATPPPAPTQAPPNASAAAPPVETVSTTKHQITINGKTVPYTATAGTLVLKKEDGKPWASMFYVAYTRDETPDPSKRPLTFSFNGGPGSSSVWLHIGALGPRRVEMGKEG